MLQRHARQLLAVAFAISVFTAMSVAPVAASESVDLGGSDGISIGTDGIGLGGEDGVQIGLDPEDGLNASVGGDEGAEVGASPDDGVEAAAGGESVGVGADGVETGDADLTDGGLDDVGSQVGDLSDGGAGFDAIDGGLGGADVPTEPTDIDLDSNDVPEDARPLTQLLQGLPETNQTGPEDAPVGDDRATVNVCEPLDLGPRDLPIGALPGLGDLPDSLQPPGLPADLVTPEAVLGIVLGITPAPCEVVNPSEPQIDPTDPPDDPRAQLDVARFGEYNDGGVSLTYYDLTLDDSSSGPGVSGYTGVLLTPEYGDLDQELIVDDGRNGYGVDPRLRYNDDGVQGETVLILLGKNAGVEGDCQNIEQYDGNVVPGNMEELQENPLGPCEYTLVGLPNLFGPGDLVGILAGLGETGDEPPVNPDALPINPDALLNL